MISCMLMKSPNEGMDTGARRLGIYLLLCGQQTCHSLSQGVCSTGSAILERCRQQHYSSFNECLISDWIPINPNDNFNILDGCNLQTNSLAVDIATGGKMYKSVGEGTTTNNYYPLIQHRMPEKQFACLFNIGENVLTSHQH